MAVDQRFIGSCCYRVMPELTVIAISRSPSLFAAAVAAAVASLVVPVSTYTNADEFTKLNATTSLVLLVPL